ncbi:RagB/SusD family nutrient uptake outer membrane protein [Chryseobacterium aquaeductus]|nr:RagB/SusD family nutrient uptake outer membrane protein [Chryseobacterium aquaeductus]
MSCGDDFLDRKPLGQSTTGDLSEGGLQAEVYGVYSKLRTQAGVSNWTKHWFQSIRSDDAMKGSTANDAAEMGTIMDNYQYSKVKAEANDNWSGHYNIIYDCNSIIKKSENFTDNGSLINKAEAQAVRGFLYFELRRDYGEIPLVLNPIISPQDVIKAKSTIAEVDAQIKADLVAAASVLPATWSGQEGRATSGMAKSYLAKLELYQGNWSQSLIYAEEVINSGIYSLNPDYDKLFFDGADNGKESVWEIQFARLGGVNYSNNYWESQGVRGAGTWDLGWGFNVPTTNLVNAYEPNDKRKAATILQEGTSDGFGNILPTGLAQPNWNKKAYTLPSRRTLEGENKNHWTNIKVLRYADVLLIAAEAALQSGNVAKATTYLNMIRTRAGLGNVSATLAAIKQERRVEFGMEGERFYDLVRWGDAVSVLGTLGYQDKHKHYPIPQSAIDQSGGVLVQNPNY